MADVPVPTTPTNPADLLRQVAEHAPKVLPERIVKPLLSALTFLAKAGHDSHHPWLAGRLARGVLALPEPSAVPATQDVDLLEVLPVVEDLVERQRQILGALVATTHPLKNDVQAVLLGMRGVVTKLRNGAVEADATTPDGDTEFKETARNLNPDAEIQGNEHVPAADLTGLAAREAQS